MRLLLSLVLGPLLVSSLGCSDDDDARSDGGGGGGGDTPTTGSMPTSSSGATGTGGEGGGPSDTCGDDIVAADLTNAKWDGRFTIAGLSSQYGIAPMVHDFATDIDGTLIAAGRFDTLSGGAVTPLARWTNGGWEQARAVWEIPPPGDGFSAIAISDTGVLALATNDSFGEMTGEIWIDEGQGLESVGAFDGRVRTLAFFDDKLWVAGNFALDNGGDPVANIAVWDGATWTAAPGGAVDGPAFELLVDGDTLYVGGAFGMIGGVQAASIAAYDGSAWTARSFDGALAIYALARNGADLYAGGAFGDLSEAAGVARWDGAAWQLVGGGLAQYQTRGVVTDLVSHDGVLDATGCFNSAGGLDGAPEATASRSFARWDGSAWQSLDDGTKGALSPWFGTLACGDEGPTAVWDVPHQRLAYDGERLVAGGSFAGAGGVASQSLIARDADNWIAAGDANLGIAGSIDFIAAGGSGCDVYGVGTFTHVGGVEAVGRVLHFDGTSWTMLADDLPSDTWCPAIDVSPTGEVAVGCMVFPPAGDAEGVVLVREGDAMVPLSTPGLGPIQSLAWSPDGALWVGGMGATGYLARIDAGALEMVEEGFDGPVQYIDVASDRDVLVAGGFQMVGAVFAQRIARFDGTSWSKVGDGILGAPTALRRDGETIYVSTYDEGGGAYLLGKFDGTTWTELATPGSGITKDSAFNFNAIRVVAGTVVAGGAAELDDGSGRAVVTYRDSKFQALHGGVNAIGVGALAVTNDAVWIAGSITSAAPEASPISSVGVARLALESGE